MAQNTNTGSISGFFSRRAASAARADRHQAMDDFFAGRASARAASAAIVAASILAGAWAPSYGPSAEKGGAA